MLQKERKKDIITQFELKENDTGSVEIQVALLTERTNKLAEHLKLYPQDHHSRHALLKVIGRQRRLLVYLSKANPERHRSLITSLGLRK